MSLRRNIVLVVGAGASKDFSQQMGTGEDLFKNILDRVDEEKTLAYLSNILDGLENFGVSIKPQDRIHFSDEIVD